MPALGIHRSTLGRWQQRAAQGSLELGHGGGNPRKIGPEHEALLLQQLQQAPDATLEEHAARWTQEQGQRVSRSAMDRAITRVNWTHKKEREGTRAASRGSALVDHRPPVEREAAGGT